MRSYATCGAWTYSVNWVPFLNEKVMRKPYRTKRKKKEFRDAYMRISDLNRSIENREIELECFIENEAWSEAIATQERINSEKIELLKLASEGWDVSYMAPTVSGFASRTNYPVLF
jgi:hypothetical protein